MKEKQFHFLLFVSKGCRIILHCNSGALFLICFANSDSGPQVSVVLIFARILTMDLLVNLRCYVI